MNDKPTLNRWEYVGYSLLTALIYGAFDLWATDPISGLWLPEYEGSMLFITLMMLGVAFTIAIRRCRDGAWHPAASLLILIPFGWLALLIPATVIDDEPMELQLAED